MSLESLSFKKFCSKSALAEVLTELKTKGLPSATSRTSIKRAREKAVDIATPYGDMLVRKQVELEPPKPGGKPTRFEFTFVNPVAWLYHISATCREYSDFFRSVFQLNEPTPTKPWEIIVYFDEVSPGNVLRHDQSRKVQVGYWSVKQHGVKALSCERHWFLLGIARSDLVKRIPGKMSAYAKLAISNFYQPFDVRQGIQLESPSATGHNMFFAVVAVLLGDEAALKDALSWKGASGTVLCPLCRNVVDHKSELPDHDRSNRLVPSHCLDMTLMDFHTDSSIRDVLQFLREQQPLVPHSQFQRMQQFLGYNYVAQGLLLDQELDIQPASVVMFDWMHTYIANGLWNCEMGLLLEQLRHAGITQTVLHHCLQTFRWPFAIASRGVSGSRLFAKVQSGDVKCMASEALSIFSVIRFILHERTRAGELSALRSHIQSYMDLCAVLDLLIGIKQQTTRASDLEKSVLKHLTSYTAAYGHTRYLPKHHYACHLGRMLSSHRILCSCLTHERKHKEVKRFANLSSGGNSFESSVLVDALRLQLEELDSQPFRSGLQAPSEPTPAMKSLLRCMLADNDSEVQVSKVAYVAPWELMSAHDVVLLDLDGRKEVGQVLFFARVGIQDVACVQLWQPLGQNAFSPSGTPLLCSFDYIRSTCVYSERGEVRIVVPPSCAMSQ